jgi:hypothetical protein
VGSHEAWRIAALCVALASAEMLHGIARTVWLSPRIGKERAIRWSIVSGSLLAFGVCWLAVPSIGLKGLPAHVALGLFLAAFMATFDIAIGRFVMRLKWPRILRDFNPASGNYLSIGLALLSGMPVGVAWLRGQLGV